MCGVSCVDGCGVVIGSRVHAYCNAAVVSASTVPPEYLACPWSHRGIMFNSCVV